MTLVAVRPGWPSTLRDVTVLTRVRVWLILFVIGLVLSGVTAFPLQAETDLLVRLLHADWLPAPDGLVRWVDRVHTGIVDTNERYPFMAYGTDWLAFAHLVIAIAFGARCAIRCAMSGWSSSA